MKKFIFVLVIISITFSLAQENQRFINVNGTSQLILNADQIDFRIQIKIINDSALESKKLNDKYRNILLAILKSFDINSKDVEVSPLTFGKNYEYKDKERVQNGYYTIVNVYCTLKDLSKYFDLTNKLAANDNFEILSSSYGISNYEKQHRLAYEKALTAAKEKAEYMCNAIGVKLGEVLEIDENNSNQKYPNPFNTITKPNSQNGDVTGKVTLSRSVRVKFSINK